MMAEKQIVAEDQAHRVAGDEIGAEQERFRDAAGPGLGAVAEVQAQGAAVAQ